jgi:mono/diheme cytochrome c family protein
MRFFLISVVAMFTMTACMEQYDPRPYWQQFKHEREVTAGKQTTLTEKGEIPPRAAAATDQDPVMAKFTSLCSSCHGADGKADSGAAAAMNPKPRNFHDKAWQAKVTDDHIAGVIKNGGASAGLSSTMPPWGAVVSDAEVSGLVAKIREWGK